MAEDRPRSLAHVVSVANRANGPDQDQARNGERSRLGGMARRELDCVAPAVYLTSLCCDSAD